MSKVFVLDTQKQPLNPVHPGRARLLLKQGKAAVYRRYPFTLILKRVVEQPQLEPLRVKIDPGSKTRHRQARFANRRKRKGTLPPSQTSRVCNVVTWVRRLTRLCPIAAMSQELVRFDTQALEKPDIEGVQYQQGTRAT